MRWQEINFCPKSIEADPLYTTIVLTLTGKNFVVTIFQILKKSYFNVTDLIIVWIGSASMVVF